MGMYVGMFFVYTYYISEIIRIWALPQLPAFICIIERCNSLITNVNAFLIAITAATHAHRLQEVAQFKIC